MKRPKPESELTLYRKGDRMPKHLVTRADKLANEANAVAKATGLPEPYMPSAEDITAFGYDIVEKATRAALPKGVLLDEYQAGQWIWVRGSG